MSAVAWINAGLLAQQGPGDTGPDFGKASPFGLLVVVLLLIGLFILIRSMNKHLRKLPESFDEPETEPDEDLAEEPKSESGG